MTAADLIEQLWREGAGVDDGPGIATAREQADGRVGDELALWGAWLAADAGHGTGVDPELAGRLAPDPVAALVVLAIELRAAVARRDHAAADDALGAIDRLIGRAPRADRGATAHAALDLALGEAALYGGDLPAARRLLEPIAAAGPTAIRIAALMRGATLALAGADARVAQTRARQALTLARVSDRPRQAEQAQLLLGLVSAMAGDADAMRATLEPLLAADPGGAFARLLLAGLEDPARASELLGQGLGAAAQRGDALGYTLCAIAGARRYVAACHRPEALIVLSAARVQLAGIAPGLVAAIDQQLHAWRTDWGDDAFVRAERDAIARLDAK